tara:strand:- start:687 stop:1091 length:405 start_codon:yes stop_codon:yes gene_type:complete
MKKLFLAFFSFLFFLSSCLVFFYPKPTLASDKTNEALIKKISRDYTKKFCNGIGFGLSKESAIKFANKENNMIFTKKIVANDLNKQSIANEIAISVVEGCGYSLDLKGEEDIKEFAKEYISMNEIIENENLNNA